MMKHSVALLVSAMTSMLAGCSLYFGGSDNDGSWNYCGEDGYYECEGNDCFWRGASCPAGSSTDPNPPGGFECTDSSDCAAGCYCANGTCEEAGFCTQDSDCGDGYVCNEDRSSCEPAGTQTCTTDADCAAGEYCDAATSTCTASCICSSDAQAASQGFDYCDELRQTCMLGGDPAGTCAGDPAATCNIIPPTCAPGDVPLLGADGCWNGECELATECADAAPCSRLNTQNDCSTRSADCRAVSVGHNCTRTDGSACQPGDDATVCHCDSYTYERCEAKATPATRLIQTMDGHWIDASFLTLN